ncbi:MAG TPA: hypothetical protein VK110_07020 [Salinisphaeraceae bacterium]|nr:hypothetical protein [Salinisphaeraceae bacterium]
MMLQDMTQTPWWLEAGAEECPFCLQHYHFEAGYHCSACDRPICPVCVLEIQASRRVLCPHCHASATAQEQQQ